MSLVERGVCELCRHPAHSHDPVRGWIHTTSATYRCPDYPYGWVQPIKNLSALSEESYESGYIDGHGNGHDDGRQAMHRELFEAVTACLDDFTGGAFDVPLWDVRAKVSAVFKRREP